ncbi:MAG: hypothetical protein PHC44_08685 [Lutispora sp.]|nr:hypothetical protein [Lutispora sp.]MDD4834793.1 hypothetical protein [Lutispora sp.]
MRNSNEFDLFEIKISFETGSEKPSRIFKAMADMIDAFNAIDKGLLSTFAVDIKPYMILDGIQTGSLKTLLHNSLTALDDSALSELNWKKLIGSFLVKGKYRLLKYLEDKNEITHISQVREIENEILLLAKESGIQKLPIYLPVNSLKLLEGLSYLYNATTFLSSDDLASFISNEGEILINKRFNINTQTIEDLLTKETIINSTDMVLRIKKPDYLGVSMWDVQRGNKTVQAKITDFEWLYRFQSRAFDIRPGDSIKAHVEIAIQYGYDNKILKEHYNIKKIYDVIQSSKQYQNSIFDTDET